MPRPDDIMDHTPFVCEGVRGLLSQQEKQEVEEMGYLRGQTNIQSVQTLMLKYDEDKETSLNGLTPGTPEPSSGDKHHLSTGKSYYFKDIIVSSSDVSCQEAG